MSRSRRSKEKKYGARPATLSCGCGGSIVGDPKTHFESGQHQAFLKQSAMRTSSPFAQSHGPRLNRAERRAQQRQQQAPAPVVASTPTPVAAPKRKRTSRAKAEAVA